MPHRSFGWLKIISVIGIAAAVGFAGGCGGDGGTDTSGGGGDGGDEGALGDGSDQDGTSGTDGGVVFGNDAGDATFGTDGGSGDGSASDANQNPCVAPASLALSPANAIAAVTAGTPFAQAYTVTATYANQSTADVTASSFFTISDPHVGTFTGATFHWGMAYGGVYTVSAKSCGVVGTTSLTLNLSVVIGSSGGDGGAGGVADAGGVSQTFNNAPPSSVAACGPTLVYPPDGVLLPPNTNVIEVHFLEGAPPNNLFEISFTNAVTNVKVYTSCTGSTAAQGMPLNGGCVFELNQAEWDYIAQTNRNGDPLTVKVRGMGCDGGNVASSNTRQISFAKEDMVGALYYWASLRATIAPGQTVNSGGIFRYDFGVRGQLPDPVLTPSSGANPTHLCIGCHTISRDGRQMIFDFDDNDDDDEYSDVRTDVYDIAAAAPAQPIIKNGTNVFPPGYHTWNRSTKKFLLSDGPGNTATPHGALRRVSVNATTLGYAQPGTLRATTPDWSPDDTNVVFAAPPNVAAAPPNGAGFWQNGRDLWFAGAGLYVAPWDSNTETIGAPTQIIASTGGKNYYYPAYSPDNSLIVFNYAASGPNFHNPLARVQVVAAGQANPTPDDLTLLNGPGTVTNSWARWSPFVQKYKGGKILWVTMSSTRDYGLRIHNAGNQNCYPTESPLTPTFDKTSNCTRAQLWMAAIRLDANAVNAGTDVSWPAFWLPFQDLTTNNHLAQWAQNSFTGTCAAPDAGTGHDAGTCAVGLCCDNGGCTTCPNPPTTSASCSSSANCSPEQCCVGGACGACAGTDAGGRIADGGSRTDGGSTATCSTCLDCAGQACNSGSCGSCTNSSECCAPLLCLGGVCGGAPK